MVVPTPVPDPLPWSPYTSVPPTGQTPLLWFVVVAADLLNWPNPPTFPDPNTGISNITFPHSGVVEASFQDCDWGDGPGATPTGVGNRGIFTRMNGDPYTTRALQLVRSTDVTAPTVISGSWKRRVVAGDSITYYVSQNSGITLPKVAANDLWLSYTEIGP